MVPVLLGLGVFMLQICNLLTPQQLPLSTLNSIFFLKQHED